MGRKKLIAKEIFFNKCKIIPNRCWEWNGEIHSTTGYGRFKAGNIEWNAHRFSFMFFKGKIPRGYHIHHLCGNRQCSNPEHLTLITPKNHIWISISPAGINHRKNKCIRGHYFTKNNTYTTPDNRRQCKKCNYIRLKKCITKNK